MTKRRLANYRKTIVSAIGAVLTWAGAAYVPDGNVERAEWYVLAVALAGTLGVYVAPNESYPEPEHEYDEADPQRLSRLAKRLRDI